MAYSTIAAANEVLIAMSNFRFNVSLERLLKRLGRQPEQNIDQE